MKWDIQTVGFQAKDGLTETTKEQIQKLEKFFAPIIGVEVYYRLINDDHQENKIVEIKLNIPGEDIYADHRSHSFDRSLHEAIEKVKRQLIRKKEVERAHT